jgi:hypothetical protein
MFRGPREDQARKVAHFLTFVVQGLSHPQRILGAVEELGRRHLLYGAKPEHYAAFGAALLWTLHSRLGDAFNPELREAWADAYQFLSSSMQRAAADAETVPVSWVPHHAHVLRSALLIRLTRANRTIGCPFRLCILQTKSFSAVINFCASL